MEVPPLCKKDASESMAFGQGAAAALPIFARYMKKIYDDPTIPITQQDQFDITPGFDPCAGELDLGFGDEDEEGEEEGEGTRQDGPPIPILYE